MLYFGYLVISFYKTCYKITHQSVEEKLCQIGQPLWKLENVLDLEKYQCCGCLYVSVHACLCIRCVSVSRCGLVPNSSEVMNNTLLWLVLSATCNRSACGIRTACFITAFLPDLHSTNDGQNKLARENGRGALWERLII